MKKSHFAFLVAVILCLSVSAQAAFSVKPVAENSLDLAVDAVSREIPENAFGGMYIDDNGQLVVNIKEGENVAVSSSALSRDVSSAIRFQTVKYSLAEIECMKAALVPYMLDYGIAILDADDVENVLDIHLYQENDAIENLIDSIEIIDSEIVRISVLGNVCISAELETELPEDDTVVAEMVVSGDQEVEPLATTTTVYPGMRLAFRGASVGYGTAGPRYSSNAFYSAGHMVNSFILKPDVYDGSNTTKLGAVTESTLGANGDKSIIKVSGNGAVPTTNKLATGGTYTLSSNGTIGTAVEMYGSYSGKTTGKITDTNLEVTTTDGITIGGLTMATYTCKQGDSGAGIFSSGAETSSSGKCYGIQSVGLFNDGESVSFASLFSPF